MVETAGQHLFVHCVQLYNKTGQLRPVFVYDMTTYDRLIQNNRARIVYGLYLFQYGQSLVRFLREQVRVCLECLHC